jgi:bifunctional DNase/RNase
VTEEPLVDVRLARIVLRDGSDQQYIYLVEKDGQRRFPIVIGYNEAREIYRVVRQEQTERPLTHQLCFSCIRALEAELESVHIIDLRQNTFYANLVLKSDETVTVVDARPSDAIALALRAKCGIRVAESVMKRAARDTEESE